MFIGRYTLDGKDNAGIYYNCFEGWQMWHSETFSPTTEDIKLLAFKVGGKTYAERKANAEELAKKWQYDFADYSWSWGEIATIMDYFYKIGKRYGLLKEFKENGIC